MMRILWFTNTPSLAEEKLSNTPIGGGWIKSLEKEIKKKSNIELGIAFFYNQNISCFDYGNTKYYPIYYNSGGKMAKLFSRMNGSLLPSNNINKFIEIVYDFKPDIIHIHGTEESFGMLQKEIKSIPIVVSIQGNINVYFQKWYSGITKQSVTKYTNLIDKILFKSYNYQIKSFKKRSEREREILTITKNIIGRTDWDNRITLILAKGRKYFHSNEILRDSFYQNKWVNISMKPFKIFTTNGNNLYKGIETVLFTAKLLDEIGFDYKWHIAGISQKDNLIYIASRQFDISISKNLIFEGSLTEDRLLDNLLSSNLYIMPSHIENSPNNLCEAMILGMPCIATDVGGTSSLLCNKKDGLLIQDGDPWSLAGAIIELKNNYEKAIEYGVNARKKAIERHNPAKIVSDLIDIYNDIIDDNAK